MPSGSLVRFSVRLRSSRFLGQALFSARITVGQSFLQVNDSHIAEESLASTALYINQPRKSISLGLTVFLEAPVSQDPRNPALYPANLQEQSEDENTPKVASKIRVQCELPRLPSLSQTPGPRNFAGAVFAGANSGSDTYLFDHQNKRSD
ncbi:hypothetical protein GX48_03159 [Paracoccidioides brasiliensis]|nr:hypothetical protein GX48_03159 [Paracoccidioides brasiliensis]